MGFVSAFFWISDRTVEKLHGIIGIPWEESVNRHIPFGLPNEGLGFPMLLGRLVYLGILAGILICLITLIGGRRRLEITETREKKKFDPMVLYLLPSALCLWAEYLLIKEFFFEEENLFDHKIVTNMTDAVGHMLDGLFSAQIAVDAFLGILVLLLAMVALIVPLFLPAVCYGSMREKHGRMTPLYFLIQLGFQCAAVGFLIIGLHYAAVSGFAEAVRKNMLELVGLAACIFLVYWIFQWAVLILAAGAIETVNNRRWRRAQKIVQDGVRRYGDGFVLVVTHDSKTFELTGQRARDYVITTPGAFKE